MEENGAMGPVVEGAGAGLRLRETDRLAVGLYGWCICKVDPSTGILSRLPARLPVFYFFSLLPASPNQQHNITDPCMQICRWRALTLIHLITGATESDQELVLWLRQVTVD